MRQYQSYKYTKNSAVYLSDCRVKLFLQDTGNENPDFENIRPLCIER